MKIPVSRMKPGQNETFFERIKPSDLDLEIGVMHFAQPLEARVDARIDDDDLTACVRIEGNRSFSCSLCLEEFNNLFEKELTLHYDIKGLESVSIDAEIREEIIVDHPIRILCKEDCKGLCAGCGANLNREACRCKAKQA